jgi:hypothetical protein
MAQDRYRWAGFCEYGDEPAGSGTKVLLIKVSCIVYEDDACCRSIQSTDHEFIPARNASLTAMHGSAGGSNVCYYPT